MRFQIYAPGPAGHGVVRHARSVTSLCEAHGAIGTDDEPDLTHVHFTDALFGDTIEKAVNAYRDWAASARRPLVVTVHDVPDPFGHTWRDRNRCRGYAAVLEASDAVIVSAEHEARKVTALTRKPVHHIDLPLPPEPVSAPNDTPLQPASSLVLLGYLYPGKGHLEAIDLAAAVGQGNADGPPAVIAAGAVSAGHGDLLDRVREHAVRRQVPFLLTGHLSDTEFTDLARSARVPVVLNRNVSASGSLLSWLSCRRRPVTWAGRYSREIDRRYPGNLLLGESERELTRHIIRALAHPGVTRSPTRPAWSDTGAEHLAVYRRVLANVDRRPVVTPC
ncbi:hypothetical protein [Amycolatopsis sp. cmx-11-32]|uniref:hypothetical protein n=1 Tax=Amycolatopsis sp. cmx-11-32 TaxID=2785796 RepID=UPI0039E31BEA